MDLKIINILAALVFGASAIPRQNYTLTKFNSSIVFDHFGKLSVGISYAHMIHDLDYDRYVELGETFDKILKNFTASVIFLSDEKFRHRVLIRASRASNDLKHAIGRVKKSYSLFMNPMIKIRNRRQLLLGGVAAITGIFSIFQEFKNSTSS